MAVKLVKMDLERIASTSTIQGGKHNNPTPAPTPPRRISQQIQNASG